MTLLFKMYFFLDKAWKVISATERIVSFKARNFLIARASF